MSDPHAPSASTPNGLSRWLADRKTRLTIGLASLVIAGLAAGCASGGPKLGSAAFGQAVRAYILEHPEILSEAAARLQERDTAKLLADNRAALNTPFPGAWAGAAKGDVVLVEFTDYACSFCRASVGDVDRLIAGDPGLKIVYREIPILGPGSEDAATVALAAARQGRHADVHRALFAAGAPNPAKTADVAVSQHLDPARLARDRVDPLVTKEIADNLALARAIGLTGTPTFVIGDQILSGAVGYDTLKQAIATARAAR